MIIGIIGLTKSEFTCFSRTMGLTRMRETEYKDKTDNYILITNIMDVHGRCFDKILDFDPLREEVTKRLPDKAEYHFKSWFNLE